MTQSTPASIAKQIKQIKSKTNSISFNTFRAIGPVAIGNKQQWMSTEDKISIREILKPFNMSILFIVKLKHILEFDEMKNSRSEWNTLHDAERKIFIVKRFKNQAYQDWAKTEAKKKSSAWARVLLIINFIDLVMKLIKGSRFSYCNVHVLYRTYH